MRTEATNDSARPSDTFDVVILGSGYAGLMAALGLSGRNALTRIALIGENDVFVERIRTQEAIIKSVPPRLPPLKEFLAKTKISFIHGRVASLDPLKHQVEVSIDGQTRLVGFERCVYALGSHIDEGEVTGVAEHAYWLDPGPGPRAAGALRERLEELSSQSLRVVVVGGANTATEAAGEIKSRWPNVELTMVSRSRVGDFDKGPHVERVVRAELQKLGIRLLDGRGVTEVRTAEVVMSDGEVLAADICVWAAGLRASPIAKSAGLVVDSQDRMWVDATLSSISHPHIIGVGDAIHPIAPTGARYRLSAFAAVISAAYAAHRIVLETKGRKPRPFSFSAYGQGVAIGRGGVGFFTFPNDGNAYFLIRRGRLAHAIRNLFVWFLVFFMRLERSFPGSALFWIGRRRVSWQKAIGALRQSQHGSAVFPSRVA